MAILRAADREIPLPDRCVVGRSRACDLVIAGPDVSGQHAVLQWTDGRWCLRDLGSRNGTYLDDVRLAHGAQAPLREGARIGFGRRSPPWLLVDGSPPRPIAARLDGSVWRSADSDYLTLPGADDPALAVYSDVDGRWLIEQDGATRELEDRSVLDAGGLWRVYLPAACARTIDDGAAMVAVSRLHMQFTVSRDEERVMLVAQAGEQRIDLQVRTHHYLLLLLARRRLADRATGLAPADEGWISQDDLLAMMRIDENNLHTSVHRARAQLGKAGVSDAAMLIERRPGTGLLRFGVASIGVTTGS